VVSRRSLTKAAVISAIFQLREEVYSRRKAVLFVNKKNQKNFFILGHGLWPGQRPCPRDIKVFCFFFSKKKRFA
jgi:hypothetical protein